MTDLPIDFVDGNELEASQLNKMLATRTDDIRPIDDTTREYEDEGGDLGSATYWMKDSYVKGDAYFKTESEMKSIDGSAVTHSTQMGLVTGRNVEITSSQTWNIPAEVIRFSFNAIGAGGGGGGGIDSVAKGGGGGGSAAFLANTMIEKGTATKIVITIGAGGAGGGGNITGSAGGSTTVDVQDSSSDTILKVILDGGLGGLRGQEEGVGGAGSDPYGESGDNRSGGNGGAGASSLAGGGGIAGVAAQPGGDATGAGAGGGGGDQSGSQSGGDGSDGRVVIYY